MHAPQIIWFLIALTNLLLAASRAHRDRGVDLVITIIGLALNAGLLTWGGFFHA